MSQPIIYLQANRNSVCTSSQIHLSDIMTVSCSDSKLLSQINHLTFYDFRDTPGMEAFTILQVIDAIQAKYPDTEIVSYGEQEFIIEYQKEVAESDLLAIGKLALLCLVIFIGSAFTIMAFNNDISIHGVFEQLYLQVMGKEKPQITELEITYSIGLAAGILVFFNHLGKKKFTSDPTPIQVQMRKYEQDVDMTFIENEGRKGSDSDAQ